MAQFGARFGFNRTRVDHWLALQSPALFQAEGALAPPLSSLAKRGPQRAAEAGIGTYVPADGHVTVVIGQPVSDLLRAPLLMPNQPLDGRMDVGIVVSDLTRSSATTVAALLRLAWPIGVIGRVTAAATDLPIVLALRPSVSTTPRHDMPCRFKTPKVYRSCSVSWLCIWGRLLSE